MPYDLYWHGEFEAVEFYIAKYKTEQKRNLENKDIQAWLIGQYVASAIATVFDTKHQTKYPNEPCMLKKPETHEDKLQKQYEALSQWAKAFKKE